MDHRYFLRLPTSVGVSLSKVPTLWWSAPLMVDSFRRRFDSSLGVAILVLRGAEIAERGVQSAGIVDLIDEAWKVRP